MHMYMYVCVHGPIPQPRADAKVRRRCFIATLAHAVIITTTISSSSPHPPPLLSLLASTRFRHTPALRLGIGETTDFSKF